MGQGLAVAVCYLYHIRQSYRKRIAAETEFERQKRSISYIRRGDSPLAVLPSPPISMPYKY